MVRSGGQASHHSMRMMLAKATAARRPSATLMPARSGATGSRARSGPGSRRVPRRRGKGFIGREGSRGVWVLAGRAGPRRAARVASRVPPSPVIGSGAAPCTARAGGRGWRAAPGSGSGHGPPAGRSRRAERSGPGGGRGRRGDRRVVPGDSCGPQGGETRPDDGPAPATLAPARGRATFETAPKPGPDRAAPSGGSPPCVRPRSSPSPGRSSARRPARRASATPRRRGRWRRRPTSSRRPMSAATASAPRRSRACWRATR